MTPRHRARRRRAARADRAPSSALRVPGRPAGAADTGDPRRVRLVDGGARCAVPAHQPHPGRLGYGGQRAADGVRQPGLNGPARAWPSAATRSPAPPSSPATSSRRPGRGRGFRACARRGTCLSCATGCREVARPAGGDSAEARAPLRGHAGHRVHGRGRAPVHAADPERQAPGAGGRALRRRRGRGRPADEGRGDRDDRRGLARCAAAPLVRPGRRVTR